MTVLFQNQKVVARARLRASIGQARQGLLTSPFIEEMGEWDRRSLITTPPAAAATAGQPRRYRDLGAGLCWVVAAAAAAAMGHHDDGSVPARIPDLEGDRSGGGPPQGDWLELRVLGHYP